MEVRQFFYFVFLLFPVSTVSLFKICVITKDLNWCFRISAHSTSSIKQLFYLLKFTVRFLLCLYKKFLHQHQIAELVCSNNYLLLFYA